jgi:hypothetical protein
VKARRLIGVLQVLALLLIGVLVIVAANGRARANTLTSFASYRATWPDAWRAPVEHRAVEVLGRLLSAPDADPEMVRAAMGVMRQSSSWLRMVSAIAGQLRGVLDAYLLSGQGTPRARIAWELFALSQPADLESYRERIIALGGDRTAQAEALRQAAERVRQAANPAALDSVLTELTAAWERLLAPLDGRPLPWLARQSAIVADAEQSAQEALVFQRRLLLEPYGVKRDASYGMLQPDPGMIAWLDSQARTVNANDSGRRDHLQRVAGLLQQHPAEGDEEPVVLVATRIALRHHVLPWPAMGLGLTVLVVLVGGLTRALLRLRRGPLPIDVNAETMENVEPIDLDTDAETRSRSSASITDVG